jgi:hypothetical protein
MASGQQDFFLQAGESVFVGWYAGGFNVALTATFAAYPRQQAELDAASIHLFDGGASASDFVIQSGPLQVSGAGQWVFPDGTQELGYILRWQVTNLSGFDCLITALYNVTSQDQLEMIGPWINP